jgi:DNA-binding MarR family transcriptional regulator
MVISKQVEKNLVLSIIKMANEIHRFRNAISEKHGLTSQQWMILLYLVSDPNIPKYDGISDQKTVLASELAEALHTSRPNITNLVNQLLKKGFLEQVKDEKDNRRKVLKLTAKGLDMLHETEPRRDKYTRQLFEHLEPADVEKMSEMLESCLARISAGEIIV